jgi:hypothetical protein
LSVSLLGAATGVSEAQEDKFAKCPDPAAAKKAVEQCLGANPYNTGEICDERVLEQVCRSSREDKNQ